MFLSENEISIIKDLQKLRSTSVLNKNGNKTSRRMFLNGVNECTLFNCRLEQARNGARYFVVVLDRKPAKIWGKTEYFDKHEEYIFYPHQFSRLVELCSVFGHTLKPIPDGYNLVEYLRLVEKRINTFRGLSLKVTVKAYTENMTDSYGKEIVERTYYGNDECRTVNRAVVFNFYRVEDEINVDWSKWI